MKQLSKEDRIRCLETITRRLYDTEVLGSRHLGGGSYGEAYWIKIDREPYEFVIKGLVVPGMHRTEKLQLETLAANTSVKMPKVYAVIDRNEELPFDTIVMEYIDGVDAFTDPRFLLVSKEKKQKFAEKVTDGLIELHRAKNDHFGYLDDPRWPSWQEFYRTIVDEVVEGAEKLYHSKRLKRKYFTMLMRANGLFKEVFAEPVEEATLIHGDLNVANMLVDKESFELMAFIDPFNSMWADRDYDLFQLNNLTGKHYRLFDTYRRKTATTEKTPLKCAYYAYMNEILCYVKSGWTMDWLLNFVHKQLKKELLKAGLYL